MVVGDALRAPDVHCRDELLGGCPRPAGGACGRISVSATPNELWSLRASLTKENAKFECVSTFTMRSPTQTTQPSIPHHEVRRPSPNTLNLRTLTSNTLCLLFSSISNLASGTPRTSHVLQHYRYNLARGEHNSRSPSSTTCCPRSETHFWGSTLITSAISPATFGTEMRTSPSFPFDNDNDTPKEVHPTIVSGLGLTDVSEGVMTQRKRVC